MIVKIAVGTKRYHKTLKNCKNSGKPPEKKRVQTAVPNKTQLQNIGKLQLQANRKKQTLSTYRRTSKTKAFISRLQTKHNTINTLDELYFCVKQKTKTLGSVQF